MSEIETIKIFHLEDSPNDAELIKEFLESEYTSISVKLALNRTQFLEGLKTPNFSIILSDYNLHDINAPEAIVIASQLVPEIPFICVSGAIGEEAAIDLYKLGAADFVSKNKLDRLPWVINRLIEELKEKELSRAMKKDLEQSEQRYRSLYESMMDAYVSFDKEGHITDFNQSFVHLLGYEEHELKHLSNQKLTPPEWRAKEEQVFEREVAARGYSDIYEKELFRKDGSRMPVEVRVNILTDSNKKVEEFWTIVRDISERKKVELELAKYRNNLEEKVKERTEQLQDARDRALAANSAKTIFLANMSHEIRTPMNAVLGFAQLLESDSSLSQAAKRKVSTIIKSGQHLLSIINNVLDMSRIESGRLELKYSNFNVRDLLYDLKIMFSQISASKNLSFRLNIAKDFPRYYYSDHTKIRQILVNLVGNAVKFTKAGSVSIDAGLAQGGGLKIEVIDTGIGINPFEKNTVFEAFERTKEGVQAAGGSGLGLALSLQCARALGGDIGLDTALNQGSTFSLILPNSPPPFMLEEDQKIKKSISLSEDLGEVRVLIIDDHVENRIFLREMLVPFGFTIIDVATGEEGLNKLENETFEIILLDQYLSGISGPEVCKRIHQLLNESAPVVIGMSAGVFEDDRRQFLASGIGAFVPKPIQINDLLNVLERIAKLKFEFTIKSYEELGEELEEIPQLVGVDKEWPQKFLLALDEGFISELKNLGEVAKISNPTLGQWVIDQASAFNIDSLAKLVPPSSQPYYKNY